MKVRTASMISPLMFVFGGSESNRLSLDGNDGFPMCSSAAVLLDLVDAAIEHLYV